VKIAVLPPESLRERVIWLQGRFSAA